MKNVVFLILIGVVLGGCNTEINSQQPTFSEVQSSVYEDSETALRFGKSFTMLNEGDTVQLGDLTLTLERNLYPPLGFSAEELGAPPDDPASLGIRLSLEERADRRELVWINSVESEIKFHDYRILFLDVEDDTVTLRIEYAPRTVRISEEEAVRIALASPEAKKLKTPKATRRNLSNEMWEIHVWGGGFDDGFESEIDATTGEVLKIVMTDR